MAISTVIAVTTETAVEVGVVMAAEAAAGFTLGSFLTQVGTSMALSMVAQALAPKQSVGQTAANADSGLTANVSSTVEPIPVVYGTRRIGGTRVLVTTGGVNNANLYLVVVHAEGEIDASTPAWYFDDTAATDTRFGAGGVVAPAAPGVYTISADVGWLPSGASATYCVTTVYGGFESLPSPPTTCVNLSAAAVNVEVKSAALPAHATGYNLYRLVSGVWHFVGPLVTTGVSSAYGMAPGYVDATGSVGASSPPTVAPASLWYQLVLHAGSDTQAADSLLLSELPGQWTAAHQLCGLAYTVAKLVYSPSVWSSLPSIGVVTMGRKIYDPRSGVVAYSANPALVIRDYLTNVRYGRGLDATQLDDASIVAAANQCDALGYTCNAVIDTSATPFDNVTALLAACRGWLIYTGGKYRLLLDRPWIGACFDFSESNITGAWKFSQAGKADRFNRVTATWINPANNWQPDIATVEDTVLRASVDHGLVLAKQIDLACVTDQTQALNIAMQTMKASRFGLRVEFRALPEGLRAEVGDVVTITHSTPGWNAKKFRVLKMVLRDDDEVEVTAQEYDDSVYSYTLPSLQPQAPATTLPDPFNIAAPGAPSVAESLYATSGSAGVKSRATLSWAASTSPYVTGYQVQAAAPGADWLDVASTASSSYSLDDVAAGVWRFRVRALTAMGRASDWATVSREILGLTAPPAGVSGLTVVASNGHALASWSLSPDLDVRIGGRIVLRWSALTTGAAWENGVPLLECNGDAVSAVLPMLTGTYLAKARDSTGNWSVGTASWTLTAGSLTILANSQSLIEAPVFGGTRSGVARVAGALQLDSVGLIDSWGGNIDSWGGIDAIGGVSAVGTYDFSAPMDLGTVATRRFAVTLSAQAYDTGDTVDLRSQAVDDWDSIDGTSVNDATATCLAAVSNDGVTYGAWFPLLAGDLTCRAVKFRLSLTSAASTHNVAVSSSSVTVTW